MRDAGAAGGRPAAALPRPAARAATSWSTRPAWRCRTCAATGWTMRRATRRGVSSPRPAATTPAPAAAARSTRSAMARRTPRPEPPSARVRAIMSEPLDLQGRHIVLGLSGGIACYKSAELVRELVRHGATVQVVMTEAAAQFITPVTMQALSNRSVYTSQWDAREPNAMAHINLTPRGRRGAGGAGQRRLHGQAGAGPRRRAAEPAVPGAADRTLPAAAGPGDEPRDVGPPGHAAQPGAAARRRQHHPGPGRGRPGLRRSRRRPHARSHRAVRGAGGLLPAQAPGRQARADHRRAHLRGHRPGARHHQPVQRQDGLRHRARRAGGRRAGDAGGRPGAACPRRATWRASTCKARSRCTMRCCRWRRSTMSSSPPRRWPTGGPADCGAQKIKKDGSGRAPEHRHDREPRHPGRGGAAAGPALLRGLCRREPRPGRDTRARSGCARTCR